MSCITKGDILNKNKEEYYFWKEEIDCDCDVNDSEKCFSFIISEMNPEEWIKICDDNYRIKESEKEEIK